MTQSWYCAQMGGREHYAVPRALHARGMLKRLMTDFWAGSGTQRITNHLPGKLFRSLAARHHAALPAEAVTSWNARSIRWEVMLRRMSREGVASRYRGYCEVGRRFGDGLIQQFRKIRELQRIDVFFGYDTCGLEVMEYLKQRGVFCILDQIDPGKVEVELVRAEQQRWPGWEDQQLDVPDEFFERHAKEWDLADRVVVNSEWSRSALVQQGVPAEKVVVVPLSFELLPDTVDLRREARCISGNVPLRVLFLGQVMLRKGIQYLARTAELLRNERVVFDVVGPIHLSQSALAAMPSNMRFHGRVTRNQIGDWYRSADVFVLPTLSDGFAITQIEAMAHGLPVIATPHCGEVVTNGLDGYVVPARDPDSLASAIMRYMHDPANLAAHQHAAIAKSKQFTLERLADCLLAMVPGASA